VAGPLKIRFPLPTPSRWELGITGELHGGSKIAHPPERGSTPSSIEAARHGVVVRRTSLLFERGVIVLVLGLVNGCRETSMPARRWPVACQLSADVSLSAGNSPPISERSIGAVSGREPLAGLGRHPPIASATDGSAIAYGLWPVGHCARVRRPRDRKDQGEAMSRTHVLSTTLTAIAGLLLASAASASVTTNYAGTSCVQEVSLSPSIIYQHSRALAYAGTVTFFACPASQQGAEIIAATASGRDLNSEASVTCFVDAMDEFDGAAFFGASVSTGVEFTGNFTLNLPPPASFFASGSKVVRCNMPPSVGSDGSSWVGSYAITEI
jgi:hypothetical protein